jgi:hypothetical protein
VEITTVMFLLSTGAVAVIQEDLDSVEETSTILTTINRTLDTRLTGLETRGKDSLGEDSLIVWVVEGKEISFVRYNIRDRV